MICFVLYMKMVFFFQQQHLTTPSHFLFPEWCVVANAEFRCVSLNHNKLILKAPFYVPPVGKCTFPVHFSHWPRPVCVSYALSWAFPASCQYNLPHSHCAYNPEDEGSLFLWIGSLLCSKLVEIHWWALMAHYWEPWSFYPWQYIPKSRLNLAVSTTIWSRIICLFIYCVWTWRLKYTEP